MNRHLFLPTLGLGLVIVLSGASNANAFFGMFGIFPAIAAVIAIFGLVADPVVIAEQLALMDEIIPPDAYNLLSVQITRLVNAPTERLGWATVLSILLALWSARAGVAALIGVLNAIAGHRMRNGFVQVFVAFVLTAVLVGLAIVAVPAVTDFLFGLRLQQQSVRGQPIRQQPV